MKWTLLLFATCCLVFSTQVSAAVPASSPAGIAVDSDDGETPETFTLSAAYPNPFNPQTSFSLTVKQTQQVNVEVFNLLGVRVRQLYRGEMQAGEPREFTFTADELPSGIYLYRVQGETFRATRQMTLLK